MKRVRSALEKENNKLRMRKYAECPDWREKRNAYARNRKRRRAYWINLYKEKKGCANCDFKGPGICYDFHHLNSKEFEVNSESYLFNLKRLFTEIRKCVVLCANCHRKEHYCGT